MSWLARVMKRGTMPGGVAIACLLANLVSAAHASDLETVAIFPFELLDSSQEGEIILKVRPEETQRLELMSQSLAERLVASKRYQIADTAPIAAELKSASPIYKCNGCEVDLAKKSGADTAILGLVQKFSDTLLSVNVQVLDAKTGTVKNSFTVGMQGNTDEAWLRGVSYIVRNRMMIEGASK